MKQQAMDISLSFPAIAAATLLGFLVFLFFLWPTSRRIQSNSRKKAAPEAGGAWPVIGHLHLLGGPQPPHVVLGDMADKYGLIFTIKIGLHRALVVNNWEFAKECLTTNDRAFANRSKTLATELLTYDGAMIGFATYGPYWRQVRKIATLELLSNRRLDMFKTVRESEVRTSVKELYSLWERNKNSSNKQLPVEMKGWFGDITLNVILRILVGKSVGYMTTDEGEESAGRWKQALRDFFEMTGRFVVADGLPFLRFLDIGGHEKAMKKTAKKLDAIVDEWLKKHKQKKVSGAMKEEEDFMHLMLNILDDAEVVSGRDPDTINKATCLALILAAADTTSVTLTWALSLLLNHTDALNKVQSELDAYVGRDRQVEESDSKNLVYLQAIIKETLRLYPAAPLGVPHESVEDCTVGGYYVPAGTRLLFNIQKIHRDPRVWCNPDEFQPERFLAAHKDLDLRGQNFEFIPFGSGRRMCPGVSFAIQVLQLTLAKFLQGFHFATPSGEPMDMSESIGLTNLKMTPLEVLLNPRLPSHLYA